jgi:protein-L-isoaspartate(D-aspartate) O-methyltransferase
MNYEQARYNMIKQQFRPWYIHDQRILELISEIHREDFIPQAYKELALADTSIPLLHKQVTMTPRVEAHLLQSLAVKPTDRILEVGTGCGYLTALLAKMGAVVHSVDIYPEFAVMAAAILKKYCLDNVHLHTGDAISGWEQEAPYDVIAVTGSLPFPGDAFRQQLQPGGRLFVITGTSPAMEASLIRRLGTADWSTEVLFETELPPLIGAGKTTEFSF